MRFRNPTDGAVVVEDAVHGNVVFQNAELDDLIIERSDGNPTYNFCVVVDDYDMKITHVIRGDDHLNNTPRQMNMLRAMGVEPPVYAHLPMILGPDGTKLSKRHGAVSVLYYREEGYLPEALLNYLARLGWSHGDQEIFTLEEMRELFDIADVNKSASAINPDKLAWISQQHMMRLPPSRIAVELRWQLERLGLDVAKGSAARSDRDGTARAREDAEGNGAGQPFLFRCARELRGEGRPQAPCTPSRKPLLEQARAVLGLADRVDRAGDPRGDPGTARSAAASGSARSRSRLRVAVSGGGVSPPIDQTLAILGRERGDCAH